MNADLKPLPLRWRLRWFIPTQGEWKTMLGDLHAWIEGKCNARSKWSDGDEWHRYRNYVWRPGEQALYAPIPVGVTGCLINQTDRVGFGASYMQRLNQRRAVARASTKKSI